MRIFESPACLLPLFLYSTGYKIMVMDVMYDDTTLKVMGIHERNSLAPDDVSAVASMDTAHMATATPFPESDLGPFPPGLDNETVLANSRAWCQARSSGKASRSWFQF
jgi:hypothetical protein